MNFNLDNIKQQLDSFFANKLATVLGLYFSLSLGSDAVGLLVHGNVILGLLLGAPSFLAYSYFYNRISVQ